LPQIYGFFDGGGVCGGGGDVGRGRIGISGARNPPTTFLRNLPSDTR